MTSGIHSETPFYDCSVYKILQLPLLKQLVLHLLTNGMAVARRVQVDEVVAVQRNVITDLNSGVTEEVEQVVVAVGVIEQEIIKDVTVPNVSYYFTCFHCTLSLNAHVINIPAASTSRRSATSLSTAEGSTFNNLPLESITTRDFLR